MRYPLSYRCAEEGSTGGDNPVHDVVEKVEEVVPDPVEEMADESQEIPPWGQELFTRVGALEHPPVVEEAEEAHEEVVPPPDEPGDGDEVKDQSPVKLPWTHRNPFSKH